VIGLTALAGVVGVGFVLMQLVTRPDQTVSAPPAVTDTGTLARAAEPTAPESTQSQTGLAPASPPAPASREIVFATKVLEANYTVQQGDSLAAIAERQGTTVERIQALNKLADPRVLSIGQKLVIPPPL
jgi:LysM repeat protein